MTQPRHTLLLRFFPSLTDFAFVLPLLFLFGTSSGANHLLSDGDTGWHLRTGEWILAHGRVPTTDLFSFTRPNEPWFAWEWLWDVIFGWLHLHWGLPAVVWASALVLSLTYALLFQLLVRRCDNRIIAIGITLAAVAGSAMHWLARPHLSTLLFIVLFLHVLERARDGRTRLLWLLPVLTILWTNLHGGFFIGLFLIGAYAAGDIVAAVIHAAPVGITLALRRARPYVIVLLICAAVTLINPYGYNLHVHIAKYLSGEGYHFEYVSEFQSIDFHHPMSRFFEPMIVAGIAAAIWAGRRRDYVHVLLIGVWLHLALVSIRNVPLFLLIAAPATAQALAAAVRALLDAELAPRLRRVLIAVSETAAEFSLFDRVPRLYLASAGIAALLLVTLRFSPPEGKFWSGFDRREYPVAAVTYLQSTGGGSNIFTDDEWGDYLIYRLFPAQRVFVDGRTDFYGSEFGRNLMRVVGARHDWETLLAKYDVATLILPAESALATVAKTSRAWRIVYDDGRAVVFRARSRRPATVSIARDGEPEGITPAGSNTSGPTVAQLHHQKEQSQ